MAYLNPDGGGDLAVGIPNSLARPALSRACNVSDGSCVWLHSESMDCILCKRYLVNPSALWLTRGRLRFLLACIRTRLAYILH